MIALFTPDAVFDRAGNVAKGHDELRQAMAERPPVTTRHLLANFHFTHVSPDSAGAVVCSMVHHGPLPIDGEAVIYATDNGRVVEFTDEYVRTEHGWRISSRIARAIFTPKVWP
jgi:hypothetical protein